MTQNVPNLATGQHAIEPFFKATQEMLSGASANFRLIATTSGFAEVPPGAGAVNLRVLAGANHDQVSIAIAGQYRYATANVDRAVSGGAGEYDVFVTASANDFTGSAPNIDVTNYAFAIAVVASGGTPGGVALYRKVGDLTWNGAAITRLRQTVGFPGKYATPKALRIAHTFAIAGPVFVPSGNIDVVPPMAVAKVAGFQTVNIVGTYHRLGNAAVGTTVTYKLQRNGADLAGFAFTTATAPGSGFNTQAVTPIELSDGDAIALVVTAIAGAGAAAPRNLSVAAVLEHVVNG